MLSVINQRFIEAAQNNQADKLKNLLDQGADIHANNDEALRKSALKGHFEVVKFLFEHGANIHANHEDALTWSAFNGRLETVKFLFAQGANIHVDNDKALRWAAASDQLETVKFLIINGANIHADDDEIFKTAIKNKNESMLMLLNAFLTEKKLLVAASGVTGASSCICGMTVLPSASTWVSGTALGSVAPTQSLPITKNKRLKV